MGNLRICWSSKGTMTYASVWHCYWKGSQPHLPCPSGVSVSQSAHCWVQTRPATHVALEVCSCWQQHVVHTEAWAGVTSIGNVATGDTGLLDHLLKHLADKVVTKVSTPAWSLHGPLALVHF